MYDDEDYDWNREEADYQQAALEAAGNALARKLKLAAAHFAAGRLADAAAACPHGWGAILTSPFARDSGDPDAGKAGFRCFDCGSLLGDNPWDARAESRRPTVLDPCAHPHPAGALLKIIATATTQEVKR